jgi:hypothetical protein
MDLRGEKNVGKVAANPGFNLALLFLSINIFPFTIRSQ